MVLLSGCSRLVGDQDHVRRLNTTAGKKLLAVARPVKAEDLSRREFCELPRYSAVDRLAPDVSDSVFGIKIENRFGITGPSVLDQRNLKLLDGSSPVSWQQGENGRLRRWTIVELAGDEFSVGRGAGT